MTQKKGSGRRPDRIPPAWAPWENIWEDKMSSGSIWPRWFDSGLLEKPSFSDSVMWTEAGQRSHINSSTKTTKQPSWAWIPESPPSLLRNPCYFYSYSTIVSGQAKICLRGLNTPWHPAPSGYPRLRAEWKAALPAVSDDHIGHIRSKPLTKPRKTWDFALQRPTVAERQSATAGPYARTVKSWELPNKTQAYKLNSTHRTIAAGQQLQLERRLKIALRQTQEARAFLIII